MKNFTLIILFFCTKLLIAQTPDVQFSALDVQPVDYIPELPFSALFPNGDAYGRVNVGGTVVLTGFIENKTATAVAAGMAVSYYLSADTLWQSTDTYLATTQVASIAASGFRLLSGVQVGIPTNAPLGSQYIVARLDSNNILAESNENNNTAVASITVLASADLAINTLTAPSAIHAGSGLSVACQVRNNGLTTAVATRLRWLLYDPSLLQQFELGYTNIGALSAGSTTTCYPLLAVATSIPVGSYQLIAVADADGAINEAIEVNNHRTRSLTINSPRPDLSFGTVSVPTSASVASIISTTYQVRNIGAANASSSTLRIYLSTNNTLGASDVLLRTLSVGSITPNGSRWAYPSINLPVSTIVGNYYLLLVADAPNAIAETNELNNLVARPISLLPATNKTSQLTSTATSATTLQVYPNPCSNQLNLTWASTSSDRLSSLSIMNLSGQIVQQRTIAVLEGANQCSISLSDLPSGMYIAQIDEQRIKFIKQ